MMETDDWGKWYAINTENYWIEITAPSKLAAEDVAAVHNLRQLTNLPPVRALIIGVCKWDNLHEIEWAP